VGLKEKFETKEEIAIARASCEESLKLFIHTMHRELTGIKYTFKPFHDIIISKLENIAEQNTTKKNLQINMPVGFGKSLIVEYFIAWCFSKNKNNTFLYTSYGDKLINKLSKEVKDIIESEPFVFLWGYKLEKDERSKVNWSIEGSTGRAGLTAGSIGGTITGLDAGNPSIEGFCGALIIDDAISASKIIYQNAREDCIKKYEDVLKTRLRRNDVPIIHIGQRLDEGDLSDYIIKNEPDDYDIVTIAAMEDDKSVWEKKISTEDLLKLKKRRPSVFYSQYQQAPDRNLYSQFKNPKYTDDETLIYDGVSHVDASYGGTDFTSFTAMKELPDGKIIAYGNLWTEHIELKTTEIINIRKRLRSGTLYLENNADKGYSEKEFQKRGEFVLGYHESMNKYYKIMTYLYSRWEDIYWLRSTKPDYISQIQAYDENSTHDDAPDSAASLIRTFEQGSSGFLF